MLRSYLRAQPLFAADLTIYGLSAKYGLIAGDALIPHYDRTMDSAQADALRPQVLAAFGALMEIGYDQLCLGLSDRYLRAMAGWKGSVPPTTAVTLTDGPMGVKLGQLRAWLEGRPWAPQARPAHIAAPESPRGAVTLAGVHLALSREEVLEQARAALATDGADAGRFRDWYVLVDGRRVAAKWLASLISGLPTTRFDAANARRALLALGLDIERADGSIEGAPDGRPE